MSLRTNHQNVAALARALAAELKLRGVEFPCVFPYNRYDHEHTAWWLSFKASPAFSELKVFVSERPSRCWPWESKMTRASNCFAGWPLRALGLRG